MAVKTSLNPSGRGTLWTQPSNVWLNQTTTARMPGQGIGSMQDYFQQYLTQMQQAQNWQQAQAKSAQDRATGYINTLSPKIDAYVSQMQKNYDAGLATLQDKAGDPSYLKQVWNAAMAKYRNPGWSQKTINQMKGGVASMGAANQAAGMRNLQKSMTGKGMAGPAADYLRASLKNRYGMQTARGLSDVDVKAATYAADSAQNYLGMAGNYASNLANLQAQRQAQIANYQQSYNPLSWMEQTQRILNPLTSIGQGVGTGLAW